MHMVPMYTPLVCFRITAYHSVDAPLAPRTGYHGMAGSASRVAMPASASCPWVAT